MITGNLEGWGELGRSR